MRPSAGKEIDVAEDTAHSPHILILKIGADAPLVNENLQGVLALDEIGGEVKLARRMADLAVADEGVVTKDVEGGGNALKDEDRPILARGIVKVADIKPRGVLARQIRRIYREGVVDIGIVRHVIAKSALPGRRHRDAIGSLLGKGGDRLCNILSTPRKEAEAPLAGKRAQTTALSSDTKAGRSLAVVGDQIGV